MTVYETWRAARTTATYGEWLETEAGRKAVAEREQEAARGPGVPWGVDLDENLIPIGSESAIDVIVHGYRETVRLEQMTEALELDPIRTDVEEPAEPFEPDWVTPPGDTIRDLLGEQGLTEHQLADALELDPLQIDVEDLLNGDEPITPWIAARLETLLGAPAYLWLARERQYREGLERIGAKAWADRTAALKPKCPNCDGSGVDATEIDATCHVEGCSAGVRP